MGLDATSSALTLLLAGVAGISLLVGGIGVVSARFPRRRGSMYAGADTSGPA
jgi:hypothetical protein